MNVLKKWLFKSEPVDQSQCIFCKKNFVAIEPQLYRDENFFVITDINQASSKAHLLVITHEHFDNALTVNDANMIREMQAIGQKILNKICDERNITQRKFRFGFHLPPFNSIDHIHLHCFIEPLTQWKFNRLHYGKMLNSVQSIIQRLEKKGNL